MVYPFDTSRRSKRENGNLDPPNSGNFLRNNYINLNAIWTQLNAIRTQSERNLNAMVSGSHISVSGSPSKTNNVQQSYVIFMVFIVRSKDWPFPQNFTGGPSGTNPSKMEDFPTKLQSRESFGDPDEPGGVLGFLFVQYILTKVANHKKESLVEPDMELCGILYGWMFDALVMIEANLYGLCSINGNSYDQKQTRLWR